MYFKSAAFAWTGYDGAFNVEEYTGREKEEVDVALHAGATPAGCYFSFVGATAEKIKSVPWHEMISGQTKNPTRAHRPGTKRVEFLNNHFTEAL